MPKLDLIATAEDLLMERATGYGVGGQVRELLGSSSVGSPDHAFIRASIGAVLDATLMSGAGGLGEEHQTAAFMGHLGTNLRWWLLAHLCSGHAPEEFRVPEISWAHQPRDVERRFGADFGIVVRRPDESMAGKDLCRLSLFQAKLSQDAGDGRPTIQVGYKPRDAVADPDYLKYVRCCRKYERWLVGGPDPWDLMAMKAVIERPSYQIETLLRTYLKGLESAIEPGAWCHYIAWPGPTDAWGGPPYCPKAVPVMQVAEEHLRRRDLTPMPFPIPRKARTLIGAVAATLTGKGDDAFILVPFGALQDVLEHLATNLPEMHLTMVDAVGDDALRATLEGKGWFVRTSTPHSESPNPPGPSPAST
ncbi:hypothetical protein [Lichenibacterium dinghuense]|uniref:hypothetical protein n=1 Tax=Lichenibacterium dinghuense TaxID=2895977 RepID=UPI001F35DE03|nr:hypothetical protein [Lichenibacterium sp. 6Y81]